MWKFLKWLLALASFYGAVSAALAWYVTGTHKPSLAPEGATIGFSVEEVTLRTSDGVTLHGWYAPGPAGSPAVALFHGYRGTRAECVPIARALTLSGYDMLLLDMRGCGSSEGKTQTLGAREALDVEAAIRFLQNDRPHSARRIGVVGVGTGASAAILAHSAVRECGAAVLIAPYKSLDNAIDHRMRQKIGVGVMPVGAAFNEVVGLRIGKSPSAVRPIDAISRLAPCPIYLVSAAGDSTTPSSEVQALFERASEPKELYVVPGITRERLTDLNGSLLRTKLTEFLDSNLR